MRFISFRLDGREAPGLQLKGGEVVDLSSVAASMIELIEGGKAAMDAARRLAESGERIAADRIELLAPIPRPRKNVFCVGRNYLDHIIEGAKVRGDAVPDLGADVPKYPTFFTKAPTTLNRPGGEVRLDSKLTRLLDWECELAVVIGQGGRDIARDQALEHVFGYTVINDITARDLQKRHGQFFKGKTLDGTCPMGPCIVDAEEIGDPTTLMLSLTVNGVEKQRAPASQMIFDVPAIIASLSEGMTLEPGDIIATGTPSGTGFAMEPPERLQDGDVVVASIDRIGDLESRIVEAGR
jgi:2-keto-4-pentenoate hydratase/2-oxohepta-3-ene-1,7-dioic acid hydratase in catechol pathway